jgi:hypothetical protein
VLVLQHLPGQASMMRPQLTPGSREFSVTEISSRSEGDVVPYAAQYACHGLSLFLESPTIPNMTKEHYLGVIAEYESGIFQESIVRRAGSDVTFAPPSTLS